MALNRYMHPRNPYTNNRPDFKKLALEHEDFRKVVKQTLDGNVTVDFKDATSLRELCRALLLSDFRLSVDIPPDRLIPTIPQRLNYLLWLEDIFSVPSEPLTGIDIGCGCCCIYGLLAAKQNKWRFVATEIDTVNYESARKNVERNNLSEYITVLPADETMITTAVAHLQTEGTTQIDFCMCNPPFYDIDEQRESLPTADSESVSAGGEVEFVKRIVDESLKIHDGVRVFTSMLGKKDSLTKMRAYLKEKGVHNIATSELCQGRTMRWVIGWSFDNSVVFPKSHFRMERKPPASQEYRIPNELTCCSYDLPALTQRIRDMTMKLEMDTTTLSQDVNEFVCLATAHRNTWSHSRRKRREAARKAQLTAVGNQSQKSVDIERDGPLQLTQSIKQESHQHGRDAAINKLPGTEPADTKQSGTVTADSKQPGPDITGNIQPGGDTADRKQEGENLAVSEGVKQPSDEQTTGDSKRPRLGEEISNSPLIKLSIELKLEGLSILLRMSQIEGEQKDLLAQIMQYFKNNLK